MNFRNLLKTFAKDESGAVTVDWVVLTAAIVGLGIAVGAMVWNSVEGLTTDLTKAIDDAGVVTSFDSGES